MKASDPAIAAEEARVRAVYAARDWSRYAPGDPANVAMARDRERRVLRLLRAEEVPPLRSLDIVDVGCGTGRWLADVIRWGATPERVTGVDIRGDSLALAAATLPAGVRLVESSGAATRLEARSFDLVIHSTVMSSVLDSAVREAIAAELVRLVRPGGAILWYDFFVNNPANRDVRRVGRGELLRLFPGCRIRLERATLAPPLARLVAPRSQRLARVLTAIPFLRTHYLGLILPSA